MWNSIFIYLDIPFKFSQMGHFKTTNMSNYTIESTTNKYYK